MDKVTENMMNEFASERDIASLAEDVKFERFVTFLTIGRHCEQSFDTEEVSVGTATGIDAIGVIVNGDLITDVDSAKDAESATELDVMFVFVQADRSPSFDASKIGTVGHAVADFFSDQPQLPRNDEVKTFAEIMTLIYNKSPKFKKGNPVCRIYYGTTGVWTNDAVLQGRIDTAKSDLVSTGLFREVTFTPLGAEGLQKQYRQAKNAIQKEFIFEKRVVVPDIPGVKEAYLGYLPVPEFMKLLKDDDGNMIGSLFNSNPRDWQNYNTVNSEIKKTLETAEKTRFVLMNNGITIIAGELRPTGDKFLIDDYQIVNGCQTSHVLFDQALNLDSSITVPVRLIVTKDEEAIKSIIKATNRQTQVTDDQFFAVEEFPKQLEDYFQAFDGDKKLYYERRSGQYERFPIQKTRIITQPDVIKSFAAMFLVEAHRTTRSYSSLKAKVGADIFGKGHRMEPYYVAAYAFYKVDFLFRNKRIEAQCKPARFHILLAARLLCAAEKIPAMNSHEMEKYCASIMNILWDSSQSDALLTRAVQVVLDIANGDFNRDTIRTETFTSGVVDKCREIRASEESNEVRA
jgi:hypothetical protein